MAEPRLKTVHEAWAAVMTDVGSIAKNDRNAQQGFTFRGIDAVMQSVGPVFRTHGVFVIPTGTEMRTETYETKPKREGDKGTTMRNVMVTMQFRVYGPGGDYFDGVSFGEAADAGDKAVTKAQSVAYRTFLLQSLTVPTGDADPDGFTHERASQAPARTDLDEALDELSDACAGLGLIPGSVAQKFREKYNVMPRKSDPATVREFIATLLAAAPDPNQTQLPTGEKS